MRSFGHGESNWEMIDHTNSKTQFLLHHRNPSQRDHSWCNPTVMLFLESGGRRFIQPVDNVHEEYFMAQFKFYVWDDGCRLQCI